MFNDNRYIEKLYNFLIIIRLNKQILDEFKLFKVNCLLVLKKEKLIWLYCGSTYSLINCQIKKKKPSYYVYFLRSIHPLSCLTISRHGQRLRILTPGKLTTMSHTDSSIYRRSRIFLQLGKGSAPLSRDFCETSIVRTKRNH